MGDKSCGHDYVTVGRIQGHYGVKGWVKIYSYTDPRDEILDYIPWYVASAQGFVPVKIMDGRAHGKIIVAQLEGVQDRDQATAWLEKDIAIKREQLPELSPGEYYWTDLIGLQVKSDNGKLLGVVKQLMSTGANDVIVVTGPDGSENLIPFIRDRVVKKVDVVNKCIVVDWDSDY